MKNGGFDQLHNVSIMHVNIETSYLGIFVNHFYVQQL